MHLELVPSFLDLVKPLSVVMTQPSFTWLCTLVVEARPILRPRLE